MSTKHQAETRFVELMTELFQLDEVLNRYISSIRTVISLSNGYGRDGSRYMRSMGEDTEFHYIKLR